MTQKISTQRLGEFMQLKQLIVDTIRDNDVYEREEGIRKILTQQTNTLKDRKSLPFNACIPKRSFRGEGSSANDVLTHVGGVTRAETRNAEQIGGGPRNIRGSA